MPAMETPLKYLLLFTGFSACAQFDSGALAAFENYLTKDLQLTTKDVGTINAMEYIVLPLASPLIPWLLRCWQVKHVLLICLIGNMLGVFMLALAPMAHEKSEATLRTLMLASRTVSGLCHAGIAVYGSVWVDLYAPKESAASWLGAMQASSLIGLVIGYTVAGYWGDWSPVFYINLVWFAGTLVGVVVMPRTFLGEVGRRNSNQRLSFLISTPGGSFMGPGEEGGEAAVPAPQAEAGEEPQRPLRPRTSVEEVIEESLLLYILLALCVSSLFFVSGGLQFWATPYMEQLWRETSGTCASDEEAERVHKMVVSLVALTTLTAPTFGVYLGGTVVDSLGGHKTAPRATLIFLVVGAAVANCCGLIACFCPMFWPAVLGFWAFNMAGAALMPGAFGLMLSAVSSRRRALASAMAQLPINLLGMAGGAFIPGWIAGCEPPEKVLPCSAGCDYAVGLRTLLFGPGVGIVLLFFSFLLVKNTTVSTESQSESTELSSSIPSRRAKRERPSGSNTLVLGIIDQLDGKAGTLVVSLDEPRPFKELLARAAIHTGNSTRRLFSEDGVEILGIDDIKRIHESSKTTPKPRVVTEESTKKQLQIDLEVVSTDGSDFKWKWGAGHASYKFGDLLIRPLWRTLAGSKQSRKVVHPPQPIPLPTTGNLKDCLPDLWIQCFPLVEKYGPLIRLRIFDDVVYVCADPDTVDIVNQIPDKRLPKEVFGCKALANQGVFIADGQRWEFGRHALQVLGRGELCGSQLWWLHVVPSMGGRQGKGHLTVGD